MPCSQAHVKPRRTPPPTVLAPHAALLYRLRVLWRGGREAEGGGLLNRYTAQKLYRGFESLPLRRFLLRGGVAERSKATVLKTVAGESPPGVRISSPPPVLENVRFE